VNDGKDVNEGNLEVTKCMLCYTNLVHVLNPNTKKRKGFITYYKTYEIIALEKHVNLNHDLFSKKLRRR
jgi:hypothetical protein